MSRVVADVSRGFDLHLFTLEKGVTDVKKMNDEVFFVVGNGPSLSPAHLAQLPDGQWLGMNSAYRYWATIDKYPRYYACLDPVVVKSQIEGIRQLLNSGRIEAFFLHQEVLDLAPELQDDPRVTLLNDFLKSDLTLPFGDMAEFKKTTGALATRFVIEQGHRQLCLLGIDCNYVELIEEAKKLEGLELEIGASVKKNPNYFFADYQSPGDKYQIPNPPRHDGNLHLQSFIALRADLLRQHMDVDISVVSPKSLLYQYGVFRRESLHHLLDIRRLACVAVPLIAREIDDFLANLRLWDDPRLLPSLQYDSRATVLHVFIDTAYDPEIVLRMNAALAELVNLPAFFADFRLTFLDLPAEVNYYYKKGQVGEGDFCRKSGPNIQFLALMAHCRDYEYSFLMEADCLPVRPGWLDALDASIGMGSSLDPWILGSRYEGPSVVDPRFRFHVNGNAIYHTGDGEFQEFIFGCFLKTLQDVIARGHDQLAYDTLISCMLDNPQLSASCPDFVSRILERYRFSNVMRNYGGEIETRDEGSIDYAALLRQDKACYLLHGRSARDFVHQAYRSFDLFFSFGDKARSEVLAFDVCWTKDKALSWNYLSKGKLELEGISAKLELYIFFIRVARHEASEVLASFQLDEGTQVTSASLIAQTSDYKRVSLDTELDIKDAQLSLKARVSEGGQNYRRLGLRLQLESRNPGALLQRLTLVECPTLQKPGVVSEFHLETPKAAVVQVIQDWQQYLAQQLKARSIIAQHSLLPVATVDFGKASLRLDFAASQLVRLPKERNEPLFQLISRSKLFAQPMLRVSLDAPKEHRLILRLCRYGKGRWEYRDFRLCGGESTLVESPFSQQHSAYRFEILQLEAVSNTPFRLGIMAEPVVNYAQPTEGLEGFWHIQEEKERLLRALLGNDAEVMRSALDAILQTPYAEDSLHALAQSLMESRKSLAFVKLQKLTRGLVLNQLKLPKLAYIDPVGKDTISATQELRKKLLSDYDPLRFYHICPVSAKPGRWQLLLANQKLREFQTPEMSRVLQNEGIDLVINRCGYLQEDAAILHTSLQEIAERVILYMMDTWDERLKYQPQTKELEALQNSFARLVRDCRGLVSINESMALHMQRRYGRSTDAVVHNFLDQTIFEPVQPAAKNGTKLTFFFGGGLEPDMTFDSLVQLAQLFAKLGAEFDLQLVLKTFKRHTPLLRQLQQAVGHSTHIEYITADLSTEEYQKLLAEVDVFLLAYNFDERSASYVASSFPNKLTDYLSHLKPIVYFGPDYAVVDEIKKLGVSGVRWCKTKEELAAYLQTAQQSYQDDRLSLHKHKDRIALLYGEKQLLGRFYEVLLQTPKVADLRVAEFVG